MKKISNEIKIEIYNKRKNGIPMSKVTKEYNIDRRTIQYFVRLIDKHGINILNDSKNRYYPKEFKKEAIERIIKKQESIWSVSIDIGLKHRGTLCKWIKNYKENGYNIVERKRRRWSTMNSKKDPINKNETKDEELIRLREEVEYLKAELEYSKKLEAVVQARKNQQQKKK